jgi:hypothetical protein
MCESGAVSWFIAPTKDVFYFQCISRKKIDKPLVISTQPPSQLALQVMLCCISLFALRNFTCCVISVPVWEFRFLLLHLLTVAVLCDATQKGRLCVSDEERQWPRCVEKGTGGVDRYGGNRWLGNRRTSQHECVYSCAHTVCKLTLDLFTWRLTSDILW